MWGDVDGLVVSLNMCSLIIEEKGVAKLLWDKISLLMSEDEMEGLSKGPLFNNFVNWECLAHQLLLCIGTYFPNISNFNFTGCVKN